MAKHFYRPLQDDAALPFTSLYATLKTPLVSQSRLARLNALHLLSSSALSYSGDDSSVDELVKRCLQAEEVSVDVSGVRERVLRIGKLNALLRDGDVASASIVVRWLTGE